MPTDLENAKLMFMCLQYSTATAFDYKKIGEACGISAGAASKRMSRLKQAVKSGKESGLDVRYLWSCIQNSDIKDIDFTAIGKELDLSNGAASKRWSRLRQALERGETGATAPANGSAETGQAGKGGKKAIGGGKKRKKNDVEDDEEVSNAEAKKGKKKGAPAAATKVKAEPEDTDGEASFNEIAEEIEATESQEKRVTANKLTPKKAATAGPKKTAAAAVTDRKAKSTPRRRPLTDEEVYAKLEVDEAVENELQNLPPGRLAYPKNYNLLETFEAMRTPDKQKTSSSTPSSNSNDSLFSVTMPYTTPMDTPFPTRNVNEVLTALSEEAMRGPSGAEERLKREQQAADNNEAGKPANAAQADVQSSPWWAVSPHWAEGIEARGDGSFYDEEEPGPDEQYV